MGQLGWGVQTENTDGRTRVFLDSCGAQRAPEASIALWGDQEEVGPGAAVGRDSGSQTGLDRGSVSCQGIHSTSLSKVARRDGTLSLGHGSNPGISLHHPRNPFSFSTVGSPASWIPHLPLS